MINPDAAKIGYFLVYKTDNSWIGKIIAKEQAQEKHSEADSQFTHVGLSLGGFNSLDALMPSIVLVDDITKKFAGRYVKLVRPKIEDYDCTKRKNIAIDALKKTNKDYGFFSLLWFKINTFMWKKRNALAKIGGYFCSYLCADSLMKYYPNFMGRPAENCMPADFLDTTKFDVIWEGIIDAKTE